MKARLVAFTAAAAAIAITAVPAGAATKKKPAPKPLAPLAVYPSAGSSSSCNSNNPNPFLLETVRDTADPGCMSVGVAPSQTEVGRLAEDYSGTNKTHIKLGKSGSITGTIDIEGLNPVTAASFAAYADVTVDLSINDTAFDTVENSGAITPSGDLQIPLSFPLPAELKGKTIRSIDLVVGWKNNENVNAYVDYGQSILKLPR